MDPFDRNLVMSTEHIEGSSELTSPSVEVLTLDGFIDDSVYGIQRSIRSEADVVGIPEEIRSASLYFGDCLLMMRHWYQSQVDFIYLDPPFNSNQNYNVLYAHDPAKGNSAQKQAFSDTWSWDAAALERVERLKGLGEGECLRRVTEIAETWFGCSGMLAYVTYMAERLYMCHRLLKPTGSIIVHCDDMASHALKMVMDCIFGPHNYLNDVIWRRAIAHSDAQRFGRIHDNLLFYSKTEGQHVWNGKSELAPLPSTDSATQYSHEDDRGSYYIGDLTGQGGNEQSTSPSNTPWKNYDVASRDRHWAVPKTGHYAKWIEENHIPGYRSIQNPHDRLDILEEYGFITHPKKTGWWPGIKRYKEGKRDGIAAQSLMLEPVGFTNYSKDSEWVGFDTQKPLALLTRLIRLTTNKGDLVLDPFMGSGTTVLAAHNQGRRWAGIDISFETLIVAKNERLTPAGIQNIKMLGVPLDLQSAGDFAKEDKLAFERWAVNTINGAVPNDKQVHDGGVDGMGTVYDPSGSMIMTDKIHNHRVLFQVTSSNPPISKIREFCHTIEKFKAAVGVFITLDWEPSPEARREAQRMGVLEFEGSSGRYDRLVYWNIREHFDGASAGPPIPPLRNAKTGNAMTRLF